jgi:hypothetical protein
MGVPWYHSLGNHDYGFSPEAQLMLNETISEWRMDGRYYHRRVGVNPGDDESDDIIVNIIVLDTNPCVRDYRQTDRRKWDPCGTEYPDCSPIMEPCRFHENILSQDCEAQLAWARQTLDGITARTGTGTRTGTAREWVFVIGHHKADEIDVADFQTTILDDPRVHLYLNGHNHNLEHYEMNGQAKYMTTGAGGMVVIGGRAGAVAKNQTRTTKSIWSKVITGFTSHTFINNGTTLKTEFWDTKSSKNSLYQFNVHLENNN